MTGGTPNIQFLEKAVALAMRSISRGGGPFGAVVVKEGVVVGQGNNQVVLKQDPSAHAEIMAIRQACRRLKTFSLSGCELYTSCEPCPMCLAALYWSRIERVYFASSCSEAARIGFDDGWISRELALPPIKRQILVEQVNFPGASSVFAAWAADPNKTPY